MRKRKVIAIMCLVTMVISTLLPSGKALAASVPNHKNIPKATYSAHVQNIGWMKEVSSPEIAGTTGLGYRLESFILNLTQNGKSMVKYRAHVQNIGWQDWVNSGTAVGTTGRSYRMEALEIKLKGEFAQLYDIYYRVHVSNVGWLGWASNGQSTGSTGIGAAIEAIQVQLVKKGDKSLESAVSPVVTPELTYKSHVANIGWMARVANDKVSGTTGESRQLEGIIANLTDPFGNSNIKYRAHVSNNGWQNWVSSGQLAGTTGQSKAIESVQFKLTGILANYYDIYYRVHASNIGWLGWAKNSESAGTIGGGIPVEAIQVKIVPKGTSIDRGGVAFYDKTPSAESSNTNGFDPIWPCANTYTVTTLYKYSNGSAHSCRFKYGIDIGAPTGEKVLAVESGKVICSEYSKSSGFGNWIMIQHNNGKVSLYAHLSSRKVSVGDIVVKGQVIGQVGNTSAKYSIAPHLHFELGNGNYSGASGDSYKEYYKDKYAGKIILTQAAKKYSAP